MKNSEKFDIRYSKINLVFEFTEATKMPENKVSAIRGGMGEMLLEQYCLSDRSCNACKFKEDCTVPRIFYHPLKIKPEYVTNGESLGYIIECENKQTTFSRGDKLKVNIILFGNVIIYFSQILQALYMLGMKGIGKEKSRFEIAGIFNEKRQTILEDGAINNNKIIINTLSNYIEYQLKKLNSSDRKILKFCTPLSQKFRGQWLNKFDGQALTEAAIRRVYLLNCMEGNDVGKIYLESEFPYIEEQEVYHTKIDRYSNTHKSHIALHGIKGECVLGNISYESIEYLIAGQLVHIGKNTSMGFGRYVILD